MATIALYNTWANQMPVRLRETKVAVMDYQEELFSLNSQILTINSRICNMEDVIGSLQATTQIQEEKISSLDILDKNNEEFLLNVIGIDEEVGALITQRKEEFYALYGYLKPECEKTWMEKAGDWFASVGEWCKEYWKKAAETISEIVSTIAWYWTYICDFRYGYLFSCISNYLEMVKIILIIAFIADKCLLGNPLGFTEGIEMLDQLLTIRPNTRFVTHMSAFDLGRCVGDLVIKAQGIAGMVVSIIEGITYTTGVVGATAVGQPEFAAVAVALDGTAALTAALSLGLCIIGGRNLSKDLESYWKDRLNESRSSESLEGGSTTEHMLSSNGTQVSSKTTWRNGTTERIDVENPAPGERPGQIHYHDANNNKYYYDINSNAFYDPKTGDLASNSIQKLLNNEKFMEGIKKALRILGE